MRVYQRGFRPYSQLVSKTGTYPVVWDTPAISIDMTFTDPLNTHRAMPAEPIWAGQAYSKSMTVAKHSFMTYESDVSSKKDWSQYYRYGVSSATCCSAYYTYPDSPVDPMNKLLAKLRGDVANMGVMAGEYRDTVRLFAGTGEQILRSVRAAKRGFITTALKELGQVVPTKRIKIVSKGSGKKKQPKTKYKLGIDYAAAHLQYKLALAPLLSDVHKLVEELARGIQEDPVHTIRVEKSSRTWLHSHKEVSSNRWAEVSSEWERRLIAYVQIDNTQLKSMSDHGLTNPASLLWELTWLSFVVDYVYNVSEWLQALDQPMQFSRSVCYENVRKRLTCTSYAVADGGFGKGNRLTSPAQSVYTDKTTSRSRRTLTAVRPEWKPSGGFGRLVTLSALAVVIGRK